MSVIPPQTGHSSARFARPLSAVSGHIASHRVASTLPLTTLRALSLALIFSVNVLRHLVDGETRRLLGWRICDEGFKKVGSVERDPAHKVCVLDPASALTKFSLSDR